MTFGHIVRLFWDMMGAELTSSPQITNDILLQWANMAVQRLCGDPMVLSTESNILCTVGTQEYDLPDDCRQVWRAAYDGQKLRLTSKWDLQHADTTWDRSQGTPRRYYVNGLNGKIGLYPLPTVNTVVDPMGVVSFGLHLYYTATPPKMVDPSDEPAVPAWAQPGVVFGMLSMAHSMIGPQRRTDSSIYWRRRFDEIIMRMIIRTNTKTPRVNAIQESVEPEHWILTKPQHPERITPP